MQSGRSARPRTPTALGRRLTFASQRPRRHRTAAPAPLGGQASCRTRPAPLAWSHADKCDRYLSLAREMPHDTCVYVRPRCVCVTLSRTQSFHASSRATRRVRATLSTGCRSATRAPSSSTGERFVSDPSPGRRGAVRCGVSVCLCGCVAETGVARVYYTLSLSIYIIIHPNTRIRRYHTEPEPPGTPSSTTLIHT